MFTDEQRAALWRCAPRNQPQWAVTDEAARTCELTWLFHWLAICAAGKICCALKACTAPAPTREVASEKSTGRSPDLRSGRQPGGESWHGGLVGAGGPHSSSRAPITLALPRTCSVARRVAADGGGMTCLRRRRRLPAHQRIAESESARFSSAILRKTGLSDPPIKIIGLKVTGKPRTPPELPSWLCLEPKRARGQARPPAPRSQPHGR